ncbi:surface lipoprotein assembly modifier [Variovorax sp. PvP013]|uniref:surface lipoprotein assembly modifier n=1 Tax=Variovorax sp. PvP013 TaxID=3156435 RepID=UPI003D1CDAC8
MTLCAFAGCLASAHAELDSLVRDAAALQQAGKARAAYDLLESHEAARAGDPDFDSVFGIAANDVGNYPRAVLALERALAMQPGQARIQAELGRALFAVGDNQAARTLLREARSGQQVPEGAARTIDQFLNAIARVEDAGRSAVRGYVEAGVGYDSNVNSGPAGANIAVPALGGLVLTLNPAGVERPSSFASVAGGLSGRFVLDPRWSMIAGANLSARPNISSASGMSTAQADANAGVSYRHERNEVILASQLSTFEYGGSQLRQTAGGTAEWVYRVDGSRQWDSYLQYARLHYPQQSVRDTDRVVLGTSYAHRFSSGPLAYGGGYVGRESTRADGVDQLGHQLVGLRAGMQAPVAEQWAAFATFGFEYRRFGGDDPFFLIRRTDRQTTLNLGMTWDPVPLWRVTPQLALTRVASNSPIADFRKAVVSVTARRDF